MGRGPSGQRTRARPGEGMAAETQKTRIERDSMGEMEVPAEALWARPRSAPC